MSSNGSTMNSRESSVEAADSCDWSKAMARLSKIYTVSARQNRNLRSMKSPFKKQDEHMERLKAKIEDLDLEYEQVLSGGLPENASPDDTKSKWIKRRVLEIEQLKKEVERGPDRKSVEHAEAHYQARRREEEKQYFFDLLKVFKDRGRGWTMEFYGLNDRIATADMATPQSMDSNASIPSHQNDEAGDLPGGDEWGVPTDVEDPAPLAPRPNTQLTEVATSRKKRMAKTERFRQRKRSRHNNPQDSLTGDRTIEFDEVFQDGRARLKYKIAQYPPRVGAFYILRCKLHPHLTFTKDPIAGAAKHLGSKAHGMGRDHKQAIRILGTRVLNCTEAPAAKNNAAVDRACAKDAEKPSGSRQPNNGARKSCFRTAAVRNTDKIMTVKPGDVCAARWQGQKGLYPIYILPLGDCPRLGFRQSAILQTKLVTQLPSCYEFDPETDSEPRWAPGYEDGGAHEKERFWPVMFFKDGRFPNVNEISFVPASRMRPYDKNNPNIRYKNEVEDFLTRRDKPTPSPSVDSRRTSPTADSDRQDSPSSDDTVPENATPRQQPPPYPDPRQAPERASADLGEHAPLEGEHEADGHGDYPYDPHTGETDDEEEEGEREDAGRSTYSFRDQRQRRKFYDGDTEESAVEEEEEEEEDEDEEAAGADYEDDIHEDDTLIRPPPRHARNDTITHGHSSQNTFNTPVDDDEDDIYEDDTLRMLSTLNTPPTSTSDASNPQFPKFDQFWQRESRERSMESDNQSSYSELLHVGLQMNPTS